MNLRTLTQWRKETIEYRLWRIQDLTEYIDYCKSEIPKCTDIYTHGRGGEKKEHDYEKLIEFALYEIKQIKLSLKPPKKYKKRVN